MVEVKTDKVKNTLDHNFFKRSYSSRNQPECQVLARLRVNVDKQTSEAQSIRHVDMANPPPMAIIHMKSRPTHWRCTVVQR